MIAEYEQRLTLDSDIRQHMPFLLKTASSYQDAKIIELGVRTGNSTSAFLAAITSSKGHLWSVDIRAPGTPRDWGKNSTWTMIVGDDLDAGIVSKLREDAAPADVLFIDTSHAYMHTLRELETYMPMVKPGGTVLLHDTELQPPAGDVKGVPQPALPVMKAMIEYCDEHDLNWENITGGYGLGVIHL